MTTSSTLSSTPIHGALYLIKGMRLISHPQLRKFALLPIVFSFIFFTAITLGVFVWFDDVTKTFAEMLPNWLQWLDWFIWFFLGIGLVMLVYFTFTLVVNFCSAPFNGLLAEAVEMHLTTDQVNIDEPWQTIIKELPTILKEELAKIFYFLTRSLVFLILFFIPGINFIASGVWLVFGAWLLTLQYADYPMGNHKIKFSHQRKHLKNKLMLVLGFGGAVMIGTMIPLLNIIIVPSAVAGATAMLLDHFDLTRIESNG